MCQQLQANFTIVLYFIFDKIISFVTNQISVFQFGILWHHSPLHQLLMFLGEIIIHLKTKPTMM